MFWCTNCKGTCQIDHYLSTPNLPFLTSHHRIARSKRINKQVRLCSSLHLMKKTSLVISKDRRKQDTPVDKKQPGQSDRRRPSINPLTQKKGVDKKKGSYARYLALKKGNLIRSDVWKYGKAPYDNPNRVNQAKNKDCCCYDCCLYPCGNQY